MKNQWFRILAIPLITNYFALITSGIVCAQTIPPKFSYQSIIRNPAGQALQNQSIGMRLSILQGSESGTAVYVETHSATTNTSGLVTLQVGGGTVVSGSIAGINWANGPYFIKTETDPEGGSNYSISGTSELLSVPFALYSANGTPGPQGPAGPQGETGAAGAQGPAGQTGPAGPQGTTGATGATGPQGPQGPTGLTGPAGPAGAKGDKGDTGAAGPQGPAGSNGAEGKNALVKTTAEAAGANCASGGTKVEAGLDANNNGVLDAIEVNAALTRYVCNGATGPQGPEGTFQNGTTAGDILYWNGTAWIPLAPGSNRQNLTLCNGLPTWGGCLPVVQTAATGTITPTTAESGGTVSDDGGAAVIERGLCWATTNNPTIAGNKLVLGNGSGSFSGNITGLAPATTYYVKAYATNANGTSYGSAVSFITLSQSVPLVISTAISNLSQTTAVSGGTITSDGGQAVVARGVCWSTSQNPTTSNSKTSDGTGTGTYSSTLSGLSPNTTYYLRAYATNGLGTGYGNQLVFTTGTPTLATLTTAEVVNVSNNSANCGGNISNEGGSVTARGVCWSTSPNPTIANSKTSDGTGGGLFTSFLTGLNAGTTYYVRAYATNASGTAYGDQKSFVTSSQSTSLALVNTLSVSNIGTISATVNCSISNQGGSGVTERGICWSNQNIGPTVIDWRISSGQGAGNYSVTITKFPDGRIIPGGTGPYYVRAYAVNTQGISYGEVLSFYTSFGLPTVSTSFVVGITNSAVGGGTVIDGGGYEVTVRGICWNTSPTPTILNNKSEDGSGLGDFGSTATGLLSNTTYFFRSYATNSFGTSYGQQKILNTANLPPSIIDIDGNNYKTVVIGSQTWMAENLKTTRYRDGTSIPYVLDNFTWESLSSGAWSYLNHDNTFNSIYGKLYNWFACVDQRGLCPVGWHVPTDNDWNIVTIFLDPLADTTCSFCVSSQVAGGKMKAVSSLWPSPNEGATNQSGFTGLPGGGRSPEGSFFGPGGGFWWSSTESSSEKARLFPIYPSNGGLGGGSSYRSEDKKAYGVSVRCLKD
jgi:uncharacterized protein (TIGR02145 family)